MVHLPMTKTYAPYISWRRRCRTVRPKLDWAMQNRGAKTNTSGYIVVVVVGVFTLTHHRQHLDGSNGTGSNHSSVE